MLYEWCSRAPAHVGGLGRRHVLHESRHIGDALRRRARRRARNARGTHAVRGRCHRRRRRVRRGWRADPPRRCCTSGPDSATDWRTCTTLAGRVRRSSTSSATTRPITAQYDAPLASDIEGVARNVSRWVRTCTAPEAVGRRRNRRDRRRPQRGSGDLDPSRRRVVARWRGAGSDRGAGVAAARSVRRDRARCQSVAIGRAGRPLARRQCARRGGTGCRRSGGRRDGRPAVVRDVPGALGAGGGAARGRPAGIPRRIRGSRRWTG